MHAAVGDATWFADETRAQDLASGFARGCRMSGAVWGGGETPALKDIVNPEALVLAGSAIGQIKPKSMRITGQVQDGDAIVLLASAGVHTNGLTMCRAIAGQLGKGLLTPIPDGRTFGEALLDPSIIYAPFIAACQKAGMPLHYAVHMTGHGWRKLMRLTQPFVYRMTNPGQPPPIFQFLMSVGPIEPREAYATFNMGAGFAVVLDPAHAAACIRIAADCGIEAWIGGSVARENDRKAVELPTLGITFESDSLKVR
jgi:phosphoribosylformylglycinamidine cyclo-ligase